MRIAVINETLNSAYIHTDSDRHYSKPIVEVGGEDVFLFKGEYHKVSDYVDENTRHVKMFKDDD